MCNIVVKKTKSEDIIIAIYPEAESYRYLEEAESKITYQKVVPFEA